MAEIWIDAERSLASMRDFVWIGASYAKDDEVTPTWIRAWGHPAPDEDDE